MLADAAHANSEVSGELQLLVRPNNLWRLRPENITLIDKIAPKHGGTRIVVVGEVEIGTDYGINGDTRTVNRFRDHHTFERGIESILRQCGLDWRTWISTEIRLWHHGAVDGTRVEHWLGQFRRLGCEWIGEHLLRSFDFWNPDRIRKAIRIDESLTSYFDYIAVKRDDPGKSGDVISNLIRKSMSNFTKSLPIRDFSQLLSTDTFERTRILFIEDSLMTGTEMTNYLSALLGIPAPVDRVVKWQPAYDLKLFKASEIEFRFSVGTSLGKLRLTKFLQDYGFENARVGLGQEGYLEVLTDEGERAVTEGTFLHSVFHNCPVDPEKHVSRQAFHRTWHRDDMQQEATVFCQTIGSQLFDTYVKAKNWKWPPEKIHLCGLGMHGLALNMGFSHSVPKATLPLFWGTGAICYNGTQLEWEPLFPNAEY